MSNWGRRLAAVGTVLAIAAGAVVVGAGVASAEPYEAVHARVHWNINLTNRDTDVNCPLTSTAEADFNPATDTGEWIKLEPWGWTEYCGEDAHGRVEIEARLLEDRRRVEFRIDLVAVYGNLATWPDPVTLITDPADPDADLVAVDLSRDASDVDAFGHFAASASYRTEDTAEPTHFTFTPAMQNGDVSGDASITLWENGQVQFSGRLHNEAFSSKDVRVLCAVHTGDGNAFTFEAGGDINGSLASIGSDRYLDWGAHAVPTGHTDVEVKRAIRNGLLTADSPAQCALEVETDTGADVLAGVGIVFKVLDIFI